MPLKERPILEIGGGMGGAGTGVFDFREALDVTGESMSQVKQFFGGGQ